MMNLFSFERIPGNAQTKQVLIKSIINQRVSHTQMFYGQEGAPVLFMAMAYAKVILCSNPNAEGSCGTCKNCMQFEKGFHPDFHLSFPYFIASTANEDTVDTFYGPAARLFSELIRENPYLTKERWAEVLQLENKVFEIKNLEAGRIVKKLSYTSFQGGKRVLILWLPEYLNQQTANKLLKIIEEPPKDAIFILVTHAPGEIISTIRSRCQSTFIKPHSVEEVTSWLTKELLLEPSLAQQYANLYPTNISRVIYANTHQELIAQNQALFAQWMRTCFKGHIQEMIVIAETIAKLQKNEIKTFIELCLDIILRAKNIAFSPKETEGFINESVDFHLDKFGKLLNTERVVSLHEIFERVIAYTEGNANKKLLFLETSFQVSKVFKS
jgi:DNA polymerase III subunit delta'